MEIISSQCLEHIVLSPRTHRPATQLPLVTQGQLKKLLLPVLCKSV